MYKQKMNYLNGTDVANETCLIRADGHQKDYIVLAQEEIDKGYLRPYRDSYIHGRCGSKTDINKKIAETYARQPDFYSRTFCCDCDEHFPCFEFLWSDTDKCVGS